MKNSLFISYCFASLIFSFTVFFLDVSSIRGCVRPSVHLSVTHFFFKSKKKNKNELEKLENNLLKKHLIISKLCLTKCPFMSGNFHTNLLLIYVQSTNCVVLGITDPNIYVIYVFGLKKMDLKKVHRSTH